MRIDRAGFPLLGAGAALSVLLLVGQHWEAMVGLAGLTLVVAFFFRDPERVVPQTAGVVVAPADGRVLVAGPSQDEAGPAGTWQQISIFLSPLDVHVNRVPLGGRVVRIERRGGRFAPAYRPEASRNAQTEIWIDCGGGTIVVRQIVGVLARRIVCRLHEGQVVATGERLGIMMFGSRMDLFLPPAAELWVRRGERVRGGETVVAVWPARGDRAA